MDILTDAQANALKALAEAGALTWAGIVTLVALIVVFLLLRLFLGRDKRETTALNLLAEEIRENRKVVQSNTEAFKSANSASERVERGLGELRKAVETLPAETAAKVKEQLSPVLEVLEAATNTLALLLENDTTPGA